MAKSKYKFRPDRIDFSYHEYGMRVSELKASLCGELFDAAYAYRKVFGTDDVIMPCDKVVSWDWDHYNDCMEYLVGVRCKNPDTGHKSFELLTTDMVDYIVKGLDPAVDMDGDEIADVIDVNELDFPDETEGDWKTLYEFTKSFCEWVGDEIKKKESA